MNLLLIALTFAAAPDWERLGTAPGATSYYDPAMVIIDAARRQVRIRAVYDAARPNGVASSIDLVEIDCVNHTGTLLEMQDLDAAGNVIETRAIPPALRRTVPAPPQGGPEEAELLRLCRVAPA